MNTHVGCGFLPHGEMYILVDVIFRGPLYFVSLMGDYGRMSGLSLGFVATYVDVCNPIVKSLKPMTTMHA